MLVSDQLNKSALPLFFSEHQKQLEHEKEVILVKEIDQGNVKYKIIEHDDNFIFEIYNKLKIWYETTYGSSTRLERYLANSAQEDYKEVDVKCKQLFEKFKDQGEFNHTEYNDLDIALKKSNAKYAFLIKGENNEVNVIKTELDIINNEIKQTQKRIDSEIKDLYQVQDTIKKFRGKQDKKATDADKFEAIENYIRVYNKLTPEFRTFLDEQLKNDIIEFLKSNLDNPLNGIQELITNFDTTKQFPAKPLTETLEKWKDKVEIANELNEVQGNKVNPFLGVREANKVKINQIKNSLQELTEKLGTQKSNLKQQENEAKEKEKNNEALKETVKKMKEKMPRENGYLNEVNLEAKNSGIQLPDHIFSSVSELSKYFEDLKKDIESDQQQVSIRVELKSIQREKRAILENDKDKKIHNVILAVIQLRGLMKEHQVEGDPLTISSSQNPEIQNLILVRDEFLAQVDDNGVDQAKKYLELKMRSDRLKVQINKELSPPLENIKNRLVKKIEAFNFFAGKEDRITQYTELNRMEIEAYQNLVMPFETFNIGIAMTNTEKNLEEIDKFNHELENLKNLEKNIRMDYSPKAAAR